MRLLRHFQLVLDVIIDPQNTSSAELEQNLNQVIRDAVNNGTLTGETPATIEKYYYKINEMPESQDFTK